MKYRKGIIPAWLLIIDVVYLTLKFGIAAIVALLGTIKWLKPLQIIFTALAAIIAFRPIPITLIIINVVFILLRFFRNRRVDKRNKGFIQDAMQEGVAQAVSQESVKAPAVSKDSVQDMNIF